MSMTKRSEEYKARFGAPDKDDEIDQIISFFEEEMQVDGLPGRYGMPYDGPDIECYIGNRAKARDYLISKFRSLMLRVVFEVK